MRLRRQDIVRTQVSGIVIAVVIAMTVTAFDVYANPGNVFYSDDGVNWTFIIETFVSWFAPLLLVILPLALFIGWRRAQQRNKEGHLD
ncbi:MAG: hypothetical protein AAAFM81_11040 [Pseudomonadota bacterium]